MEFLPMKRFRPNSGTWFPKFSELRHIKPVVMTMDLEVWDDEENIKYLDELADKGLEIFPVRRLTLQHSGFKRTDFPQRILFEMTSICNAQCQMCPQMNLKRKLVHMDKEKYKSIIDELEQYGLDGLWLYHFGESLTHPNFQEIIEYVKHKQNLGYLWLSTNGILLDEKNIDLLLSSSLSFLNFSLQSISVENYKKIAPTSPAEKIFANLNRLIAKKKQSIGAKPFFRLQMIEQEHTVTEIDAYLQTFYDKCDLISVNMLEHTDLQFNKNSEEFRNRKKRARCNRIDRSDCFINSDGSVAICDNAYNNQMDIGNVWDASVYDIWNGKERQRILSMNGDGSIWDTLLCKECTDYDL